MARTKHHDQGQRQGRVSGRVRWARLDQVTGTPWQIAARWAQEPPAEGRTLADEVDELVAVAALRAWTERLVPGLVHRTVLAGGTLATLTAATGMPEHELVLRWQRWAADRRPWWQRYGGTDEYTRVARVLGIREDS